MTITVVAGARPNFIKIAPILRAFKRYGIHWRLVHTGQHYDKNLSDTFFVDLDIPPPDINFNIGSGTQAEQTGAIMIAFEQEVKNYRPSYVLVVGDVNSTMACGIVAKKENIPLIHVEAGLRSGDLTMPEEINRLLVDRISDVHFTTTAEASKTLIDEGVDKSRIHFVGNVMIDSLISSLTHLQKPQGIELKGKYIVLTLHRPSNVDQENKTISILQLISQQLGEAASIVFPVHPRTRQGLIDFEAPENVQMVDPMRYLEFIYLIKHSVGVITDSGGIQEETTFLKIPCITLRNNTERPETIEIGTNELIGDNEEKLKHSINNILTDSWKAGSTPELWDGKSAERIAATLLELNT